ncbi:hypothetical protein Tco_0679149 [Tanacetum coccineum]|uniref:Tf2-1-like SH3-like domain-containing protein n=1 Tax=Tanacetum coccineum TaxID=301880 RepID=A0ABQ4XIA4_9ASTR
MEESVVRQLCRLRLEKKSYADKKRKPLKFSVGDYVLLKVSPWKGVVRFGKKGKLAPRFVRPFEIIEKAGPVVYRLDFPEELNGVHDTFHVSNLKKCLADPTLQVPLNEIRVDDKLNFVEEPMEILERDFKKLKRSKISIVKVRWNLKCGPEFTWEREDQMKLKYPHLCSDLNTAYPLPSDTAYPAFCPIQRIHPNRLIRLRMTKVIKGEFEKMKDVKVEDVSLTCDTPLEVFNKEHEADDDMGYDPSDIAFIEWLASKNFNYKTMDHYTMKALWIYWIRGDDEVDLTDKESSDDEDEIAEVFRIDTNIFNYETPLCSAFNEFNYLLKVDPDLLTKDIMGFKTYEDYKDDWIYEWNKDVPWVYDKPWLDNGIWKEPTPVKHTCKPFNYKTGCSEWPTCSWRDDGYCNGGNLPRTYIIGNQLHYQDYEWYEALEDCELKNEALRNKAIMEGFIKDDDDESRSEQIKRWNIYANYDDAYEINHEKEELCEVCESPVCNVRRYMMIKYSFNNDDEYVAIKEDEYDDLTKRGMPSLPRNLSDNGRRMDGD